MLKWEMTWCFQVIKINTVENKVLYIEKWNIMYNKIWVMVCLSVYILVEWCYWTTMIIVNVYIVEERWDLYKISI